MEKNTVNEELAFTKSGCTALTTATMLAPISDEVETARDANKEPSHVLAIRARLLTSVNVSGDKGRKLLDVVRGMRS
jgi:hypothetical protein